MTEILEVLGKPISCYVFLYDREKSQRTPRAKKKYMDRVNAEMRVLY